jgi:hypothetical protein
MEKSPDLSGSGDSEQTDEQLRRNHAGCEFSMAGRNSRTTMFPRPERNSTQITAAQRVKQRANSKTRIDQLSLDEATRFT